MIFKHMIRARDGPKGNVMSDEVFKIAPILEVKEVKILDDAHLGWKSFRLSVHEGSRSTLFPYCTDLIDRGMGVRAYINSRGHEALLVPSRGENSIAITAYVYNTTPTSELPLLPKEVIATSSNTLANSRASNGGSQTGMGGGNSTSTDVDYGASFGGGAPVGVAIDYGGFGGESAGSVDYGASFGGGSGAGSADYGGGFGSDIGASTSVDYGVSFGGDICRVEDGADGGHLAKRVRLAEPEVSSAAPAAAVSEHVPTEQELAAAHYDTLERSQGERHESCIYHLRSINNFVKSYLITMSVDHCSAAATSKHGALPRLQVLDMCCGHGGDFIKWMKAVDSRNAGGKRRHFSGVSYTGADIAPKALEDHCKRRVLPYLRSGKSVGSKVNLLVCADMTKDDLVNDPLPCIIVDDWLDNTEEWTTAVPIESCGLGPNIFDIISVQFSFHYMCQSAQTLHHFFDQMAQLLRRPEGDKAGGQSGQVIITTVDSRAVFNLITQEEQRREWGLADEVDTSRSGDAFWAERMESGCDGGDVAESAQLIVRHNGKILCRITYDVEDYQRLCRKHGLRSAVSGSDAADGGGVSDDDLLGFKYYFQLFDVPPSDEELQSGFSSAAVNAPEWLVPVPVAGGNAHSVSVLAHIAAQYDLQCSRYENFHTFISKQLGTDAGADLFQKMHGYNFQGTVTDAEWKIIGLYAVIVFDYNSDGEIAVPDALLEEFSPVPEPVFTADDSVIAPSQAPPTVWYPVPSSPILPVPVVGCADYPVSPCRLAPASPRDVGLCPTQPPPTLGPRCLSPVLPFPVHCDGFPQSPLRGPVPVSPTNTGHVVEDLACREDLAPTADGTDEDQLYSLAYKLAGSREAFYALSEEEQEEKIGLAFVELNP